MSETCPSQRSDHRKPDPNSPGILFGIGVGPGDPELITVKALKQLQAAQVVAFPAGKDGQPGLAENIIQRWLQPFQYRLRLAFPYTQDASILTAAWQKAANEVWHYLQKGDVVFACEGDVSFYSTFNYLAYGLQQQYPAAQVRVIPGVCSPVAAAAALGIPLVYQGQQLAILPALYNPSQLKQALGWADVVVLLKVSGVYTQVWDLLAQDQLLPHAMLIERATTEHQVIHRNIATMRDYSVPYFSLMMIQKEPFRPF